MVAKRYYFKLLQRASTFSQGLFCTTGRKESILLFWPLFGLLVITLVLIKKIQKTNKNMQKTHTNLKNKTTQCFFQKYFFFLNCFLRFVKYFLCSKNAVLFILQIKESLSLTRALQSTSLLNLGGYPECDIQSISRRSSSRTLFLISNIG